jgi:hypothetical protein
MTTSSANSAQRVHGGSTHTRRMESERTPEQLERRHGFESHRSARGHCPGGASPLPGTKSEAAAAARVAAAPAEPAARPAVGMR